MPVSTDLLARVDAALWEPQWSSREVESVCTDIAQHHGRALCVNGSRVELARTRLEETPVQVVAWVGFPLGAMDGDAKRYEAEVAIDHGAQEIELVLNVGRLKDGDAKFVLRELRDVAEAADERPVCVALETHLLTREEILVACGLVLDSGVTAVSNGTGFWPETRASVDEVKFLREALGPKFQLKATGTIGDRAAAEALLQAGATRLGLRAGHLPLFW